MRPKGQLHDVYVDFGENVSKKDEDLIVVKPWSRYWARTFDGILLVLLVLIITYPMPATFTAKLFPSSGFPSFLWGVLIGLIMVFVESIFLSVWGTTPGKSFYKIKITTIEGKKPTFLNALRRSFKVWFFGLAMGVPFIDIFTMISAHSGLLRNRITSWDRSEHFKITHVGDDRTRVLITWLTIAILCLVLVGYIWFDKTFNERNDRILHKQASHSELIN